MQHGRARRTRKLCAGCKRSTSQMWDHCRHGVSSHSSPVIAGQNNLYCELFVNWIHVVYQCACFALLVVRLGAFLSCWTSQPLQDTSDIWKMKRIMLGWGGGGRSGMARICLRDILHSVFVTAEALKNVWMIMLFKKKKKNPPIDINKVWSNRPKGGGIDIWRLFPLRACQCEALCWEK